MRIVPQSHRQFAARFSFRIPQPASDIDKLASSRCPETMHSAPMDAQLVMTLPDLALWAFF